MPYNSEVVHEGKRGVEVAREHLRHQLADELLARLLREDRDHAYIAVDDLEHAGLGDLLGGFWLAFGYREHRRLARSVDWRLALVREVLQSVGHDLPSLGRGRYEVDVGAYITTKEALAAHQRAQESARKRAVWQRDNLMTIRAQQK